MICTTSLEAYFSTEGKRASQRDTIFYTIKANTGLSSSDISALTRIPRTSVTGRLRELEDEGMIAKDRTKKDPVTNMTVHIYKAVGA